MHSALYVGNVMHERFFPRRHRMSYGVWYLLADLDARGEEMARVSGRLFRSPLAQERMAAALRRG